MEDMKLNLTVDDIMTIIDYLDNLKVIYLRTGRDESVSIINSLIDKLKSISL